MSIRDFNKKQYEIFKEAMFSDKSLSCREMESVNFYWFSCFSNNTNKGVSYKISKKDYIITVESLY